MTAACPRAAAERREKTKLMNLSSIYGPDKFGLSFELFPPKSASAREDLFRHLDELVKFAPDFITCTYGAGGSTREKTLDIVSETRARHGVPVASHLTCVGSTRDELRAYLNEARRREVEMIVALRGDPPRGETSFRPVDGGLAYASELVALVRGEFPEFAIAVAGYPETHREAASPEADLKNLRTKVSAGGDVIITQLFYDNQDFFRFRERSEALGIKAPIVPGILPITNLAQVQRISSMCGARLPLALLDPLVAAGNDAEAQFAAGVEYCAAKLASSSRRACRVCTSMCSTNQRPPAPCSKRRLCRSNPASMVGSSPSDMIADRSAPTLPVPAAGGRTIWLLRRIIEPNRWAMHALSRAEPRLVWARRGVSCRDEQVSLGICGIGTLIALDCFVFERTCFVGEMMRFKANLARCRGSQIPDNN